jgi:hypothetical protein
MFFLTSVQSNPPKQETNTENAAGNEMWSAVGSQCRNTTLARRDNSFTL